MCCLHGSDHNCKVPYGTMAPALHTTAWGHQCLQCVVTAFLSAAGKPLHGGPWGDVVSGE